MTTKFYALLIFGLFLSSCVAPADNSSIDVRSTAVISRTPTYQRPSEPTLMGSLKETASLSEPEPPICPDLPRPAMVFQAKNDEGYIFRHVASKSECMMQFDPPISRLHALTASGVYYSTADTGEESTNQK